MTTGTLFGVGLGPGDPELVTVKAARVIGEADVVAYHSARHPSFGGAWLPTVYFNVEEASAKGVGAKLNVDAEISTLANAGPANAPVPQFDVVTTIRTKGAAIKNMYETSTFIVSGNKAPTLAKAVN